MAQDKPQTCTKCGETSTNFTRNKSQCRPCRAKVKRVWRKTKEVDETVIANPKEGGESVIPKGYHVKGTSTLYDANGIPTNQWVKTQKDPAADRLETLLKAIPKITAPFKGKSAKVKCPRKTDADTLAAYLIGDPHVGLFSWEAETGTNHDLKIAEGEFVAAIDALVDVAPASENALIFNAGDFFHADNQENKTARSGHTLDVDTRWAKVLEVGIRIMRRNIDRALEKHKTVTVINEIGNHDDHSSIVLSLCLADYYNNNPRVKIDTSPSPFHWFRFGKCLIGTTHGHNVKAADLPLVMANDRKQDWAETEHRVFYCGHVHHDTVKELNGVTVETLRTIAPRDYWSHSKGFRSGQDMKVDVWHRDYGRVTRHTVGIGLIKERLKGAK